MEQCALCFSIGTSTLVGVQIQESPLPYCYRSPGFPVFFSRLEALEAVCCCSPASRPTFVAYTRSRFAPKTALHIRGLPSFSSSFSSSIESCTLVAAGDAQQLAVWCGRCAGAVAVSKKPANVQLVACCCACHCCYPRVHSFEPIVMLIHPSGHASRTATMNDRGPPCSSCIPQ